MKKVLAFLTMMFAVVQTANAFSPPPVFEGDLFVTNATSACTAAGVASTDGFYRAVYAPHLTSQNKPDAIALFGPRNAVVLVSTSAGRTLRGNENFVATSINASTGLAQFNGSVKYTIKPTTITATTPVVQISGTTSNFGVAGCTITVVAALGLRP